MQGNALKARLIVLDSGVLIAARIMLVVRRGEGRDNLLPSFSKWARRSSSR